VNAQPNAARRVFCAATTIGIITAKAIAGIHPHQAIAPDMPETQQESNDRRQACGLTDEVSIVV